MKSGMLKHSKFIILLIIILFFFCYYGISFSQFNNEIMIHVKTISGDYPALKTNLQMPVFTGFFDEWVQEKVKEKVEKDVLAFLDGLVEDSEKYLEAAKEAGWEPRNYIGETTFELHYMSDKVLSFSLIFYSYTLGAHGFTERVSYNFDLKIGTEITLQDLFQDYDQYIDLINQEIKKQITTEKELYFNEGQDFQSIQDNQTFYIQYDGIVVYFGLYEIAPYAEGIRYFKIPFRIFRGMTSEHLRYFDIN